MDRPRARLAVSAAIAAAALATAAAPALAAADYGRSDLQRDVDAIHRAGVTGALAEVVTPRRRIVARSGVGSVKTRRPVPLNAYFRINSTTKTYVSTVVLQLVAEGRLSLEDSVERWLPGVVAGHDNDGRTVTVRQLLQHTSGLRDYDTELPDLLSPRRWRSALGRHTAEQLVAIALRRAPNFAPGTSWSYSNTNYLLAGMIVERVTGRSWDRELEDRIFRPLGLRHTVVANAPVLPRPHAQAYQQFRPGGPMINTTNYADDHADGALVSTTGDVHRFFRALMRGAVLPPAQLAEMRKTVPAREWWDLEPGARYGLGITWRPLPCGGGFWYHGGDGLGTSNFEGVSPDGRRSVVLSTLSKRADPKARTRAERADVALIDHAMCGAPAKG